MTAEHKNRNRAPLRPLDWRTLALSSGGLGFLRPMPGTWGSLPPAVACGVVALLVFVGVLGRGGGQAAFYAVVGSLLAFSGFACVAFGRYAERRFALPGGEAQKDAPEVVADETAGQAVALLVILPGRLAEVRPFEVGGELTLYWLALGKLLGLIALGFIAFRGFDIVKPWPVRRLERLPHGWGVLLDDLMAGVYAAVIVLLAQGGLALLP